MLFRGRQAVYPLNKLNIELSYIDENDFELYKKEKHSFNTSEQVQIEKTFVEIPTVSFRDLNVEHFIKYDYAFIKLSQKRTMEQSNIKCRIICLYNE